MIYLLFYLIKAAVLLLIPVAWLVFWYQVSRKLVGVFYSPLMVRLVIVTLSVSPLVWMAYGWFSFLDRCREIQPFTQYASIDRQRSLLLRTFLGYEFGKSANIQVRSILDEVGPLCIESEASRPVVDRLTGMEFRYTRSCGGEYLKTKEPISDYSLTLNAQKHFAGLGYIVSHRLENLKDSSVVAEAGEAIFGRGALSNYIGLLSGSNNPEYLACGYVDRATRIWRNSRFGMGEPEYEAYKTMDQRFFSIAAGRTAAPTR